MRFKPESIKEAGGYMAKAAATLLPGLKTFLDDMNGDIRRNLDWGRIEVPKDIALRAGILHGHLSERFQRNLIPDDHLTPDRFWNELKEFHSSSIRIAVWTGLVDRASLTPEDIRDLEHLKRLAMDTRDAASLALDLANDGAQPDNQIRLFGFLRMLKANFTSYAAALKVRPHKHGKEMLVEDEYDLQYLVTSMFKLFIGDVQLEAFTTSAGGLNVKADAVLPEHKSIVEFKYIHAGYSDKEISKQIMADIPSYRADPRCENIYFFVYDPNRHLRNPAQLEALGHDITSTEGKASKVTVMVAH